MQYLTSSQFIESDELVDIMNDKELMKNLVDGLSDLKKGDYTLV